MPLAGAVLCGGGDAECGHTIIGGGGCGCLRPWQTSEMHDNPSTIEDKAEADEVDKRQDAPEDEKDLRFAADTQPHVRMYGAHHDHESYCRY